MMMMMMVMMIKTPRIMMMVIGIVEICHIMMTLAMYVSSNALI